MVSGLLGRSRVLVDGTTSIQRLSRAAIEEVSYILNVKSIIQTKNIQYYMIHHEVLKKLR